MATSHRPIEDPECRPADILLDVHPAGKHNNYPLVYVMGIYDGLWGFIGIYRDL